MTTVILATAAVTGGINILGFNIGVINIIFLIAGILIGRKWLS
jgi:hypothetical protein